MRYNRGGLWYRSKVDRPWASTYWSRVVCAWTLSDPRLKSCAFFDLRSRYSGGGSARQAMSSHVWLLRFLSHWHFFASRSLNSIRYSSGSLLASRLSWALCFGSCWHCNANRCSISGSGWGRGLLELVWMWTTLLISPTFTASSPRSATLSWVCCPSPWCGTCKWTRRQRLLWLVFWAWVACKSKISTCASVCLWFDC